MPDRPHVVIVTGMSGAGRSRAAMGLEDLGYFVVDNLPPALVPAVVEHIGASEPQRPRLALVIDTRGGLTAEDFQGAHDWLENHGYPTTVLFLDADDSTLVRRFEESRRPHPGDGGTLAEQIALERTDFEDIRGEADLIVDTTDRTVHDLRRIIEEEFSGDRPRRPLRVAVTSFGFKWGVPRVADLVFDVRFLPNPHWQAHLRPLLGTDAPVREFVFSDPDAQEFLDRIESLLDFLLPRFEKEGKAYVTVAVGCTGGHHRSVAMAEEIAKHLVERGTDVTIRHRDVHR